MRWISGTSVLWQVRGKKNPENLPTGALKPKKTEGRMATARGTGRMFEIVKSVLEYDDYLTQCGNIRGAFVVITTLTTEKTFSNVLGNTAEPRLRMTNDGFQKVSRSDRRDFQREDEVQGQYLQHHSSP